MANAVGTGRTIGQRLVDAGIVPPMTTHVSIEIKPDAPLKMFVEAYVTEEQFEALEAILDPRNRIQYVKEFIFKPFVVEGDEKRSQAVTF